MKKNSGLLAVLLILSLFVLSGCGSSAVIDTSTPTATDSYIAATTEAPQEQETLPPETPEPIPTQTEPIPTQTEEKQTTITTVLPTDIPEYNGKAYIAINGNQPYFSSSDYSTAPFENYAALDSLGRCGVAYANICIDIMPTEERGSIGQVKPTGWHTVKYDNVDGKYLYNRCHLIGFQLAGENANTRNLITGTRYMNTEGMLPFENMVADYVKETHNHVLYRVTPMFDGNNLLAKGVLMEALSVEDKGDGICFNVFCYNVQPGISINYATGDSSSTGGSSEQTGNSQVTQAPSQNTQVSNYIGNKNTKKFHTPSCSSVSQMSEKNKEYLNCTRDEAISKGYDPCKRCNP